MKRLEFTCDGCDLVEYSKLTSSTADSIRQGWIQHRAVVYENGSQCYEISADLCPDCADKMRRAANPENWPRLKTDTKEQIKNR